MSDLPALVIDVGNTRIKWGLCHERRLSRTGGATHEKLHDTGFAALTTKLPRDVDKVLVSNVAGPDLAARLTAVIGLHCDAEVRYARSQEHAFGVTNGYRRPRSLGVDRWVAMIGAFQEIGGALCVVDAGTAVTIDAIDEDGNHLGGQIIPGLDLMASALRAKASDIPVRGCVQESSAEDVRDFATGTDDAIARGAFGAVCGSIERAERAMRDAGLKPRIVLTGGDASRILNGVQGDCLLRPHLVLQGLAHMLGGD